MAATESKKLFLKQKEMKTSLTFQQGVCILLCVKERDNPAPAKVYYADLWGTREEKYNTLSATDVLSIDGGTEN